MIGIFEMGGYSSFIWPSYGITFMTLIWLYFTSWKRAKNAAKNLQDAYTPKQD